MALTSGAKVLQELARCAVRAAALTARRGRRRHRHHRFFSHGFQFAYISSDEVMQRAWKKLAAAAVARHWRNGAGGRMTRNYVWRGLTKKTSRMMYNLSSNFLNARINAETRERNDSGMRLQLTCDAAVCIYKIAAAAERWRYTRQCYMHTRIGLTRFAQIVVHIVHKRCDLRTSAYI
ncbi:unnamed protein product [Trichogramma brassicae]|uniref:Uncharacterized protein n=1 Tax=Trichogramma brassicae TaxID=86971 RepID=A0A6H5J985_9HYME|nr:unnamed protein product [Trichogramma brassicae]